MCCCARFLSHSHCPTATQSVSGGDMPDGTSFQRGSSSRRSTVSLSSSATYTSLQQAGYSPPASPIPRELQVQIQYRVLAREQLKGLLSTCHTFTSKALFYTPKTHIWVSIGLCATCRKGGGVRKMVGVNKKGGQHPTPPLTALAKTIDVEG